MISHVFQDLFFGSYSDSLGIEETCVEENSIYICFTFVMYQHHSLLLWRLYGIVFLPSYAYTSKSLVSLLGYPSLSLLHIVLACSAAAYYSADLAIV